VKKIAQWFKGLFVTKAAASPGGLGSDLIPFAVQSKLRLKTKGKYRKNYPSGVVVHYTAGRRGGLKKALDSIKGADDNEFTYLVIGDDGSLVQAHPVSEWGYHAGESAWPGLGTGVSRLLIGVEMNCAGELKRAKSGINKGKLVTWFDKVVPEENVRYVTEDTWGCPTGYYESYTPEQEETLIKLCLWLKKNDPTGDTFSFDYVLGHHEVAGKKGIGRWRKTDPGGSLSMSMPDFRALLKRRYEAGY